MTWSKGPWHVIHSYAHMCVNELSDRFFFSEELRHTYVNLSQKKRAPEDQNNDSNNAKFGGPLNFSIELTNKGLDEWLQEVTITQKATVTPESSPPNG